jgi:hypothetical protein
MEYFYSRTNEIIFYIVIILYVFNWVILKKIKIGFEEFLLVKSIKLSLTILSHLTSHLIGTIWLTSLLIYFDIFFKLRMLNSRWNN